MSPLWEGATLSEKLSQRFPVPERPELSQDTMVPAPPFPGCVALSESLYLSGLFLPQNTFLKLFPSVTGEKKKWNLGFHKCREKVK